MSLSLPQGLPLALRRPSEWQAGRSIFEPQAAPVQAFPARRVNAGLGDQAVGAWRVIPGAMGLPSLIVPAMGEIIP